MEQSDASSSSALMVKYTRFSPFAPLERLVRRLSPFEWVVFLVLLVVLFASSLTLLLRLHTMALVEVPARGGTLVEGVVDIPRYINPLFATSDTDRDLVTLIYSGLMRYDKDGVLVPDLAESYSVSDDGLTYTFILKEDLEFHDGEPLTADDVIFTISKAQDPTLRSVKLANWDGVLAQKVDDRTVTFTLKAPYVPFLENTTLGILPAHKWKELSASEFLLTIYNTEPVGSGPYRVYTVSRTSDNIPTDHYLRAFAQANQKPPYVTSIHFRYFSDSEDALAAYQSGNIDSLTTLPSEDLESVVASQNGVLLTAPISRLSAVFFNQNKNELFADVSVRKALDAAVDKDRIVKEIFFGYGSSINGPLPISSKQQDASTTTPEDRVARAKEILEAGGWKYSTETGRWEKTVNKATQTLAFTLATNNIDEFKGVAERLKADWEALGVPVDVQYFEVEDLKKVIIRPREYEALLFGLSVTRGLDLFAYWHSSQRNDPGANIGLYANITADKLLEEARTTSDNAKRAAALEAFDAEVKKDTAAVFLYTPDFVYITPKYAKGVAVGPAVTPSDRFASIRSWHVATEYVWKIFQSF